MPHSFGLIYTTLMRSVRPIVPIMVNIHYAVNQTTPEESYRLGQAVRAAIESWSEPSRVGVAGNGGLSAGVLREDLDKQLLNALRARDLPALRRLPSKWIQGPSARDLQLDRSRGRARGTRDANPRLHPRLPLACRHRLRHGLRGLG